MPFTRRAFLTLGFLLAAAPVADAAEEGPPPSWEQVSRAIDKYFAADKSRQPLDIVTQSQAAPLFGELEKLGWNVADREEILARVPRDNEFIVKQLRSKQGRKFMREFARYPEGFDKLDQLAKLPHGKSTIERLVKGPDGYKLLEYLNTAPGGANMQKQLARTPRGKGFTKETGRIYTAKALKDELKKSHARAANSQAQVK